MIGFDPIDSGAIGELSQDGADVLINATSFAVSVAGSAPAVHGGASVSPVSKAVAVITSVPLISISAAVKTVAATVAVTTAAPQIQADAARLNPPTAAVAVATHAPIVSGGSRVLSSAAPVTVTTSPPMVTAGASISPTVAAVATTAPHPSIVAGNAVDARNTITMNTTFGEIASASIGELGIGEGEPSTRVVLQSPFIVVMASPPFITAGKSILPSAANVNVTSPRCEIDSRDRKLRILAIAS